MRPSGRPARADARRPAPVAVLVEAPQWRAVARGLRPRLRRAARLAIAHGSRGADGGLTILLAGDDTLHRLNRDYRGKDKPTNVLSFPASGNAQAYLGDIAIAHGVTAREAEAAGKTLADHATHLAVHGVLHLLGYDHETAAEARIMEPLEVAILSELGIADPYAARAVA